METGCREHPADSGVLQPQMQQRIPPEESRTLGPMKPCGTELEEEARGQTPSAENHLQLKNQQDQNQRREKLNRVPDLPPLSPLCFWRPWRTSGGV